MFTNKNNKLTKPSFSDRIAGIKSIFKAAYEQANNLHSEMEEDIKAKNTKIAELQKDIDSINITKKETEEFMSNIGKFI